MKASIRARPFSTRFSERVRPGPVGGTVAVIGLLLLLATALWQLKNPTPQPYQAAAFDLRSSGALALSVSFTDLSALTEASLTRSGFRLVVDDAPVAFALDFVGSADLEAAVYDLSGGTYPLTLNLLREGEAYHRFSATEGSVTVAGGEVTVSAFLSDELSQQLFLSVRLDSSALSQACSESYRFCFSGL